MRVDSNSKIPLNMNRKIISEENAFIFEID